MLVIDASGLRKVTRDFRAALTMLPFWAKRDLRVPQEEYFFEQGIDGGGKVLSANTVKARRRRWGYYKRPPRSRVSSQSPFGVWSGNTLEHTWKHGKARVSRRVGVYTIQHSLKRNWISEYWDNRIITKWLVPQLDRHVQAVFDGQGLLR